MQILVLHPGALGDTILSLPALRVLKKRFPEGQVTFAGNTDYASVVAGGYAERLTSLSSIPLHLLYQPEPPSESAAQVWNYYDRIVSWTGHGSREFSENLYSFHPNVLVASWRPEPGETRHVSRIFVESLYSWIPVQDVVEPAQISLSAGFRLMGEQWLAKRGWSRSDFIVALHPGAGAPGKRWHWRNFHALAARLLQIRSSRILVVEGPAEPMCGQRVAEGLDPLRVQTARDIPLGLLAALLESCGLFVGNDSGIAHMAAGLGTPSVVLFGPTEPTHWSPLGPLVLVLRGASGNLKNLCVDEVFEATESLKAIP